MVQPTALLIKNIEQHMTMQQIIEVMQQLGTATCETPPEIYNNHSGEQRQTAIIHIEQWNNSDFATFINNAIQQQQHIEIQPPNTHTQHIWEISHIRWNNNNNNTHETTHNNNNNNT